MKLTKEKALDMLECARKKGKDTGWIDHSLCVGETAAIIASHLHLDCEKAETLGLIHDIGKSVARFLIML